MDLKETLGPGCVRQEWGEMANEEVTKETGFCRKVKLGPLVTDLHQASTVCDALRGLSRLLRKQQKSGQ